MKATSMDLYRKINERGNEVTRQELEDKEQEEYLAEWLRKKKEKKKLKKIQYWLKRQI